jgi:hypothetical protein
MAMTNIRHFRQLLAACAHSRRDDLAPGCTAQGSACSGGVFLPLVGDRAFDVERGSWRAARKVNNPLVVSYWLSRSGIRAYLQRPCGW